MMKTTRMNFWGVEGKWSHFSSKYDATARDRARTVQTNSNKWNTNWDTNWVLMILIWANKLSNFHNFPMTLATYVSLFHIEYGIN